MHKSTKAEPIMGRTEKGLRTSQSPKEVTETYHLLGEALLGW